MQRLLPEASHVPDPSRGQKHRYYALDWLRAFVILALVPSHAIGFFTANTARYYGTQYASPVSLSTLMTVGAWGIALLFLIAGAVAYSTLDRHTPSQFMEERCIRLLIPFLFASLTLIPLQDFLIIHTFPGVLNQVPVPVGWNPQYADSPVMFYRWFVSGYVKFLVHYTPNDEFIFWSHLWFIPHLLVISLLTLPLLIFLRGAHGTEYITWLALQCERHRGAVFLFALPLAVVLALFGWQWQGWQVVGAPDGVNVLAQFAFYMLIYLYGFVLFADARLRQVVRRDGGVVALTIAILAFLMMQLPGTGNQALAHDYSVGGILAAALRAVAAWLCVIGIVGLSMRFLTYTNQVGQYLTEAL